MRKHIEELRRKACENSYHYTAIVISNERSRLSVSTDWLSCDIIRNDAVCEERNGIKICRQERTFDYIDANYEEVIVTPELLRHNLPLRVYEDLALERVGAVNSLTNLYTPDINAIYDALKWLVELAFAEIGIAVYWEDDAFFIPANHASRLGEVVVTRKIHSILSRYIPSEVDGNRIKFEFGHITISKDSFDNYLCKFSKFDISRLNGVLKPFKDAYYGTINSLKRVDVRMKIDTYVVEIHNTYPLALTIPVTINIDGEERTYVLTAKVAENHFYADGQTEAIVRHMGSAVVRIKFAIPGVYKFSHVPHGKDDDLTNTIIIRQLIRSTPIDAQHIINNWGSIVDAVYAFGRIEVPVVLEIEGSIEDTLRKWIKDSRANQMKFDGNTVLVGTGNRSVLIRYEVHGNKVILKSFEKP
ncbi:hypothetical protein Tneu_1488 [Pyrobaculum neutrophilum V24Sta]|uniref:Uncharacterized protein n=2 Tax=Pyrobaculum neutrophilum TaxID=70771 RepID=B1Y9I3_PYRNV|nr:hypothetical protein Tneu_1488 [Pyrobaculum neutrophilum V24Sta]